MEEDIKKLLEENLAATKEMQALVVKTARYVKWLRVMDLLKLLLIIIPLIAAWIYVPQLLEKISESYGNVLPLNLFK